jgi:hypothetical protein
MLSDTHVHDASGGKKRTPTGKERDGGYALSSVLAVNRFAAASSSRTLHASQELSSKGEQPSPTARETLLLVRRLPFTGRIRLAELEHSQDSPGTTRKARKTKGHLLVAIGAPFLTGPAAPSGRRQT